MELALQPDPSAAARRGAGFADPFKHVLVLIGESWPLFVVATVADDVGTAKVGTELVIVQGDGCAGIGVVAASEVELWLSQMYSSSEVTSAEVSISREYEEHEP
jgi:hypothetical protein